MDTYEHTMYVHREHVHNSYRRHQQLEIIQLECRRAVIKQELDKVHISRPLRAQALEALVSIDAMIQWRYQEMQGADA